jgi:murein DD-endopeptidase MepM/ murein hydrolase activator NlpD
MPRHLIAVTLLIAFLNLAAGAELSTGKAVNDETCAITAAASVFRPEDRDAFVRIVLPQSRPADQVRVEWIDPAGLLADEAEFRDLPSASRLCLVSRLSIAGFPPAQRPGAWTVRVRVNGRASGERRFRIERSGAQASSSMISTVTIRGEDRIDLAGAGFRSGSIVHIARFTAAGGWQYLDAELPFESTPTTLAIRTKALDPGEYVAVIRDPDGSVSAPMRFVISTGRVYSVPVPTGERPLITQGPNGSFSHWNRSLHAFDIVPQGGRYVAAMRAGVAYTHDLGLRQTPRVHSFGNYITIDHGDGEYSHYAHLATGGFLVRDGQRVAAGQPLAVVGNSGYTLGAGGGYHVHVHVTQSPAISAQSIPFTFGQERPAAALVTAAAPKAPAGDHRAVSVAQWWTEVMTIPARTQLLRVRSKPDKDDTALDLHLVSPSGTHYGPDPAELKVPNPEPGPWRIAIEGMRGGPGPIDFTLESHLESQKPRGARKSAGAFRN